MKNPIAVSSWSLHHHLGLTYANGPEATAPLIAKETFGPAKIDFLALPVALAERGYHRVELCHFHLASQDPAYLKQVRQVFKTNGVIIQTLLIDDGDITNPATCERDMKWIESWIRAAALLGAEHVRVIAGKAKPSDEALAMSVKGLKALSELGQSLGVRVVTENWFDLLSSPKEVTYVLDHVSHSLGFLADTGNWSGLTKYQDLQAIFARAQLCHAKASFGAGLQIDEQDFGACLKAASAANYTGPLTLIFADEGDEWQGLELERTFIQSPGSI